MLLLFLEWLLPRGGASGPVLCPASALLGLPRAVLRRFSGWLLMLTTALALPMNAALLAVFQQLTNSCAWNPKHLEVSSVCLSNWSSLQRRSNLLKTLLTHADGL